MLLGALATGFSDRVTANPAIPERPGSDIVPVAAVEQAAVEGGLAPAQAQAVTDDYGDAQLEALRLALGAVALAALLSLWCTRRLPETPLAESAAT